jgi:hypothetical protein
LFGAEGVVGLVLEGEGGREGGREGCYYVCIEKSVEKGGGVCMRMKNK